MIIGYCSNNNEKSTEQSNNNSCYGSLRCRWRGMYLKWVLIILVVGMVSGVLVARAITF